MMTLALVFPTIVSANEPQLITFTLKKEAEVKTTNIEEFEINNSELIELRAFNSDKQKKTLMAQSKSTKKQKIL